MFKYVLEVVKKREELQINRIYRLDLFIIIS